jgi:hypothetical protein
VQRAAFTLWSTSSIAGKRVPPGRQRRLADYPIRLDFGVLGKLSYLPFAQVGGQLLFHLISRLAPVGKQAPPTLRHAELVAVAPLRAGPSRSRALSR